MLTSMLKRLDLTIFAQAEALAAGTFEPGINILGLAEGGVGYATEDGIRDSVASRGLGDVYKRQM